MQSNSAKSLEEIKKMRKPYFRALVEKKQQISGLNKLAVWITERVGSMGFFLIIFAWTVTWLTWNMAAPKAWRFDPFPGFVLWLFISNMIQLFLMPMIMIGQNIQSRAADIRSEADFEINKQAEIEIETVLNHLEYQNNLIIEILEVLKDRKPE